MRLLVTGGAGYIGSFMVDHLISQNHEVVVVDSLEEGHESEINKKAVFMKGDLLDEKFVLSIFDKNEFDGVLHFAAYISMKESTEKPGKYFRNNFQSAVNLLDAMENTKCRSFIFSSTAGVYGNPVTLPIPEDHIKNPENPYGESKYLVERVLPWYCAAFGIGSVVLRYFNAAGASLDGVKGEAHRNETHIIPNIIKSVLQDQEFPLFGTDYNTSDGSCVRDYIHVLDLVQAHSLALEKLLRDNKSTTAYNVGTGNGYSNREVISMVEKVSGRKVRVREEERRPGDADSLVADVTKIKSELGFSSSYSDLETIVSSAWKWHSNR